jgi:hypothetical protein
MGGRNGGWGAVVLVVLLAVLAGCGGGSSKPTSVSQADLQKDGPFWKSLTPDLRDELVDMGKNKLGQERPDGATQITAVDNTKLIAEMDKQYANSSKQSQTIYDTYVGANDKIAHDTFNQLAPQLGP